MVAVSLVVYWSKWFWVLCIITWYSFFKFKFSEWIFLFAIFRNQRNGLKWELKLDCVKYITIYCIYWIFSNSLVERLKRSLTASAELLQTASRREGSCDILSQSVSGEDWANSFEECRISCTVTLKTFLKEIFLKTLFHHIM